MSRIADNDRTALSEGLQIIPAYDAKRNVSRDPV
jgi:hypothetical protein